MAFMLLVTSHDIKVGHLLLESNSKLAIEFGNRKLSKVISKVWEISVEFQF